MCLFCQIIKKEIPSKILYEDDLVLVILDAFPKVNGHTLIIPKEHFPDFLALPNNYMEHIHKIAKNIGLELMAKLSCKSLTLNINYGESQEIKHFHLHLLPDYPAKKKIIDTNKIYELFS